MKKRSIIISLFLIFTLLLVGCSTDSGIVEEPNNENPASSDEANIEELKQTKIVKIGGVESAQARYEIIKPEFEKLGWKSEFVVFDSNVLPITACNDGSLDISYNQHIKFMQNFNKNNNGDLVMIEPYVASSAVALYSSKYNSVEEIPDNGSVAVMNDAMNQSRSLIVLRDAGLIELSEVEGGAYSIIDIKENPKNLEFIEMEQGQIVRVIDDMDAILSFTGFMFNAGYDPTSYLARDNVESNNREFPQGVIVKKENETAPWAVDFNKAARMPEVVEQVKAMFPGVDDFIE